MRQHNCRPMRYMNGGGEFSRTLARAWSSQSARRRVPGIRLPREKRKAMVESFVKQYQQSNNGKFPSSLSLTRQEVGGSPLVLRHILQEVKVVWSRDQAQKPGLAQRSPQGHIIRFLMCLVQNLKGSILKTCGKLMAIR